MKTLPLCLLSVALALNYGCMNLPVENKDVIEFEIPPIENPCPEQDVWIYLRHKNLGEPVVVVIVFIPKCSLSGAGQNCPGSDTKVVGEARAGINLLNYVDMRIVILKRGYLNNSGNYTIEPPEIIEKPADNFNLWHTKR